MVTVENQMKQEKELLSFAEICQELSYFAVDLLMGGTFLVMKQKTR